MTPFERLDTAEARACYRRIEKRLRAEGAWLPQYALGLAPVAAVAAAYLDDARRFRTMSKNVTPETVKLLAVLLLRKQRLARQGLKLFAVLPPATMNAQGVDAVIETLCALLPKLVDPTPAPPTSNRRSMLGSEFNNSLGK